MHAKVCADGRSESTQSQSSEERALASESGRDRRRHMSRSTARLVKALLSRGQTVAVAETSAGGLIAAELLAQPGASKFFKGGVVCYTKASKQQLLGIAPESSKPTSTEPHARELAMAAQAILAADWAIGETGVAGPTPNSRGIHPGVSALAACGPGGALARKTLFPDDRLGAADAYGQAPKIGRPDNMLAFRDAAIELLADAVEASAAGPTDKL